MGQEQSKQQDELLKIKTLVIDTQKEMRDYIKNSKEKVTALEQGQLFIFNFTKELDSIINFYQDTKPDKGKTKSTGYFISQSSSQILELVTSGGLSEQMARILTNQLASIKQVNQVWIEINNIKTSFIKKPADKQNSLDIHTNNEKSKLNTNIDLLFYSRELDLKLIMKELTVLKQEAAQST